MIFIDKKNIYIVEKRIKYKLGWSKKNITCKAFALKLSVISRTNHEILPVLGINYYTRGKLVASCKVSKKSMTSQVIPVPTLQVSLDLNEF